MRISKFLQRLLLHQHWGMGIVRAPIHSFLQADFQMEVDWFSPPHDSQCFEADPFAVCVNGKTFVLYEEFDYRTGKGHISSLQLGEDGRQSRIGPVIESPFHLSYPYPILHQGTLYCVPESCWAGEVAIHEAVDFPRSWRKKAVLLKGVYAIDSTLFQHQGLWWLACCRGDVGDYGQLFLWYAEDLFGPWTPHRRNPVKSDPRSARPAGTPFLYQGELFRPAQDCSQGYGRAVALNHVTRLTPAQFSEQTVRVIEPSQDGPYPLGIHTLSAAGDLTILDGKRHVFHSVELRRRVSRGLTQILTPRERAHTA